MRILALAALALALPPTALSAGRAAPNPCRLLTTPMASAALGAPAKPYPSTSRSRAKHCLYIAASGRLDLEIGARAEYVKASSDTSPPGTVIKNLSFGENGGLVYAPSGGHRHISLAAFELGSYYYSVYSEQLTPKKISALAKLVYDELPH